MFHDVAIDVSMCFQMTSIKVVGHPLVALSVGDSSDSSGSDLKTPCLSEVESILWVCRQMSGRVPCCVTDVHRN